MTDYADLEKRLREMASAWKRWGADGVFKGALHSDIVSEAADALISLQKAISLADAKLALAMVYAADAAAADHRAQSAPAARAAITHIRNARGDLGDFLSREARGQDE